MKVDRKRLELQIEGVIFNGIEHCEEIDLTVSHAMREIEPLILAVEALNAQPPPQISQETAREMLRFIKHAVVSCSYEYPVRRSELIQKAEQELNTK